MWKPELTSEEIALVRKYVDIPPGAAMDRLDVQRARIAEAAGGRFHKVGPGLYEIVIGNPRCEQGEKGRE
ncbi:hypothetical protein AB0442_38485 [Kitasatospora sp. NPDC085895]|uniref:hypothetical protein n=1 Tax=Kitasatospora sp. NPDC085895 TaxID=3155057 RepID=UPI00344DBBEA